MAAITESGTTTHDLSTPVGFAYFRPLSCSRQADDRVVYGDGQNATPSPQTHSDFDLPSRPPAGARTREGGIGRPYRAGKRRDGILWPVGTCLKKSREDMSGRGFSRRCAMKNTVILEGISCQGNGIGRVAHVLISGVSAGCKEFCLRQSVKRAMRQRTWSQLKVSRRFSTRTLHGAVIVGYQNGGRTVPCAIEHRSAPVLQFT